MTTGQRIRKLRRERDWTQSELGERAGVNYRNIPRYETDKLNPGLKVLQKFADAFGVVVEDLMSLPAHGSMASTALRDQELFHLAVAVDQLDEVERNAVKSILQAVVFRHQVQSLGRTA